MKTSDTPIVVEQVFHNPVKDIWKALTEVDQMKQWFFDNIDTFKPEVGFETQFVVRSEHRKFTHLWKITEATPYQSITYNWKYVEYPGDSSVTFELVDKKEFVNLRVSMGITEDFPQNVPEFTRESCIQGWDYFIRNSLKGFLSTQSK